MKLKYGSEIVEIKLPEEAEELTTSPPTFQINKNDFISDLDESLSIKEGSTAAIVVSDKTRLCGYEKYLPWITEYLESKGLLNNQIIFYIAYGTHPIQSDSESLAAYGETFKKYTFVHHNCDDNSTLTYLGTTSAGTEVKILKDILNHDVLILFGAISHHYFAGYGGGRKLLFPGLAGRDAIYHNHKLFIDFDRQILSPGCQSGALEGNPVAADLKEIDSMMPQKLIISGILDTSGQLSVIRFNKSYSEFEETCKEYDQSYKSGGGKRYDLVIASAGGYPKDINFIQTHKSLHNAASFVKDGGSLILLGECRDGIGNDSFIDIFSGSTHQIINDLSGNYSGNGGTALSTLSKTGRINVMIHTSLSDTECSTMGIEKINIQRIANIIKNFRGTSAVIRNASIIF